MWSMPPHMGNGSTTDLTVTKVDELNDLTLHIALADPGGRTRRSPKGPDSFVLT